MLCLLGCSRLHQQGAVLPHAWSLCLDSSLGEEVRGGALAGLIG